MGVVSGVALLVLTLTPETVLAHERRPVANGKYDVVVGWDVEPAFVGMKNAASIRIMDAGTTNPVSGAEKGLRLAVPSRSRSERCSGRAAITLPTSCLRG
jgi:hypothetical protein